MYLFIYYVLGIDANMWIIDPTRRTWAILSMLIRDGNLHVPVGCDVTNEDQQVAHMNLITGGDNDAAVLAKRVVNIIQTDCHYYFTSPIELGEWKKYTERKFKNMRTERSSH
jgi:hypothetical protein